jgi:hypothetical protein
VHIEEVAVGRIEVEPVGIVVEPQMVVHKPVVVEL